MVTLSLSTRRSLEVFILTLIFLAASSSFTSAYGEIPKARVNKEVRNTSCNCPYLDEESPAPCIAKDSLVCIGPSFLNVVDCKTKVGKNGHISCEKVEVEDDIICEYDQQGVDPKDCRNSSTTEEVGLGCRIVNGSCIVRRAKKRFSCIGNRKHPGQDGYETYSRCEACTSEAECKKSKCIVVFFDSSDRCRESTKEYDCLFNDGKKGSGEEELY